MSRSIVFANSAIVVFLALWVNTYKLSKLSYRSELKKEMILKTFASRIKSRDNMSINDYCLNLLHAQHAIFVSTISNMKSMCQIRILFLNYLIAIFYVFNQWFYL